MFDGLPVNFDYLKLFKREISPFFLKVDEVIEKNKIIISRLSFDNKPRPDSGWKEKLEIDNGIVLSFLGNSLLVTADTVHPLIMARHS